MAITPMTDDLNIIQGLADEPNDVTGLTAAQLKAKYDAAGNTIKTYLNGTMIPSIDAEIVAAMVDPTNPPGTASAPTPNTLMMRDASGRSQVADPVNTQDAVSLNYFNNAGIQIGDTITTARTNLGTNYLLCNGAALNPATYPTLYNLLPTTPAGAWTKNSLAANNGFKVLNGYYITYYSTTLYYCPVASPSTAWASVTMPIIPYTISTIAYGNGYWVISNSNNPLMYYCSSSGAPTSTWTQNSVSNIPNSTGYQWDCIVYMNGYWAVSYQYSGSSLLLAYRSSDPTGAFNTGVVISSASTSYTFYGMYYESTTGTYLKYGYSLGVSGGIVFYATTINGTWSQNSFSSSACSALVYANSTWAAFGSSITYASTIAGLGVNNIPVTNLTGSYFTFLNGAWMFYGNGSDIWMCYSALPTGPWVKCALTTVPAAAITTILYNSPYYGIFCNSASLFYYVSRSLPIITTPGCYTYIKALQGESMDIGIITNPTLPPIVGYVEVEVDGVRQYQQVENSQNSVISDLQQQNTLLTDTLDNLMTSILPELMGK